MLLDKLIAIETRYSELESLLSQKEVINDRENFQKYSKELKDLEPLNAAAKEYRKLEKALAEAQGLKSDPEMKDLAESESKELEAKKAALTAKIETLLIPVDPLDEKNIIIEVRAGTGGDEAALFAGDLLRMYLRYAENHGFKTEMIESNSTGLGGYKEAVFSVIGKGAYSKLKYEGGVHRVQRVPKTESSGRIHTSAATVAVLPEVEDIDIHIDEKDLRVDTYRASGPGGQNVNKVSSAIRITHIPTGMVVACQEERNQHQNRAMAMKLLRAKLYEAEDEKNKKERKDARRVMVGSGDRSEKIRTYNFPQGRITDHRIGLTVYNLQQVLDGKLDEVIEGLSAADRVAKLEKSGK